MKFAIRTLAEIAPDYVLAPERHLLAVRAARDSAGLPLGDLVVERRERIVARATGVTVVLDTSHARDGLLDVTGASREENGAKSAKKRAELGDIVVSRLRPYLRQVAFLHPSALLAAGGKALSFSTEFYVLAPRDPEVDLAFLLPFFLSKAVQASLAEAQEGGHHPRVPRASLFALRVPRALVKSRANASRTMNAALADSYRASERLRELLAT